MADVLDERERVVVDARNETRWQCKSKYGNVIVNDGTVNAASVLQAVNGSARISFRVGSKSETVEISAHSPGLGGDVCRF